MSDEEVIEEMLDAEEKKDLVENIEFDLAISPADPTLEVLAMKIDSQELIVPFYQRKYVWTIEQASKLIESFLIGLPVPQVFFYVNDEEILEIIDGQQRILSVKYFMDGYFGEPDLNDKRRVFKLKGLSKESKFYNKTFSELENKDKRKIKNSTLRAIHIKQISPVSNNDCVFHIFQRLNTGGTQLKPQEIRNAVYRGNIVDQLQELAGDENWLKILGLKKPHKNQKDVELVLRIFGLFNGWEQYERPMLKFLNNTMASNSGFDNEKASVFSERFPEVIKYVSENISNPFRPKGSLNTAILESVVVALMEFENLVELVNIETSYKVLLEDEEYQKYVVGPTADVSLLKGRITKAKHILTEERKLF